MNRPYHDRIVQHTLPKITFTESDLELLLFGMEKYLALSRFGACARARGVSDEDYDFLFEKMYHMATAISDRNRNGRSSRIGINDPKCSHYLHGLCNIDEDMAVYPNGCIIGGQQCICWDRFGWPREGAETTDCLDYIRPPTPPDEPQEEG